MASLLLRARRTLAANNVRPAVGAVLALTVLGAAIVIRAAPAGAISLGRTAADLSIVAALGGSEDPEVAAVAEVTDVAEDDPCRPAPGTPIPNMVAEIFRCRLAGHLAPETAARVAAEAVVVAQCESRFDPDAVVFDGAFVNRAHPRTGMRYTATGVFQFIRATADTYLEGGYAHATDPVRNIEAAVALYLDNRANGGRGWESWECSGVNGAFRARSVLPGWPGGPPTLPAWAFEL